MPMLDVLRRIVQEVNATDSLARVLDIIVKRVKRALKVDVCSVYLVPAGKRELVLMATKGLNPESRFSVRLGFAEGLVGLVAERAEPVNVDNAPDHPRYKYFPVTGEERYHAFLGIPITQHRKLLGVLVVQHLEQRRFGDDHTAFLITLAAQLAGAISHAEASGEIDALREASNQEDLFVGGVSGAPGVAIGQAWVAYPVTDLDAVPDRGGADTKREMRLFKGAIERVQDEMLELKERLAGALPSEERVLFDAYVMMLGSENLVEPTIRRIREGNWAPGALRDTIRELAGIFEDMDDSYMRERGTDIRDLGCRILTHLEQSERSTGPRFSERTVLIGENVTVAELADVPPGQLAGVVSGRGSESSHVAILARALGVPAVMAAVDLPFGRLHGREVVVDGYRGRVYIEPEAVIREEFLRLEREEQELSAGLGDLVARPAITPDGERIPVYVNSGLLAEIHLAYQSGSDGIGLYRTEFPFMIRDRFPSEDEQYEIYRHVLEAVEPRPVVLRTLDVGGDKPLAYFPVKEDNPFLGWRGIRITLDHPEIFLTQLRAMLRASVDLNNMRILFPMISTPGEVDEALGLLRRAWCKLRDDGLEVAMPQVGVMVEVPSAVYMAEALARRVDFLSVGTNDLIQYLLAVDRNNAQVSDLYSSAHPAVLKALGDVVAGARAAGKPVSLCGEMASDPAAVILLLGLGIDSLSVSVAGLSRVKWVINSFTRTRAREILGQVMALEDPAGIRERLDAALVEAGLGGLVHPGRS